ncbi:hypothetical protein CCB80_10865 [Armatimonadetes bacterium Uphvl-Ar1]|nr:hypothetical protein CCB80_10865 [Armatimonadetes bacterium Uphvl-Ar1]
MNKFTVTGLALAFAVVGHAQVFSNNGGTGDNFTNAGGSNQGQLVGTTGWAYNNVRNNGSVGISTANPYNGNGSVRFEGTQGPGGSSSKSDIEYLVNPVASGGNYFSTGSLGKLNDLVGMSYRYYRDSSSTNDPGQMVAARILIDADGDLNTTGDRGGLVWELAYNGGGAAPLDQWVLMGLGGNTNVWNFGAGMATATGGYNVTLNQWKAGNGTVNGNSAIIGFSYGVGSGWGPNLMFLDDAAWQLDNGITNQTTSSNFEVVPEPMTMTVLALAAFVAKRKRKQK